MEPRRLFYMVDRKAVVGEIDRVVVKKGGLTFLRIRLLLEVLVRGSWARYKDTWISKVWAT